MPHPLKILLSPSGSQSYDLVVSQECFEGCQASSPVFSQIGPMVPGAFRRRTTSQCLQGIWPRSTRPGV